jgi:hypothetical protein
VLFDAFICHASEDKDAFVRPLAERLVQHHLEIWFDEFTLDVGEGLRRAIERGLANSQFAIVVLSPAFFAKNWPQRELDGLVAREIVEDRRLVLPIWHGITRAEVARISPMLADVVAIDSAGGLDQVCERLLRRLRPEESPLIAARDELIRRGVQPPVITDEWWLDMVEATNRVPAAGAMVAPEQVWGRWSFHLPHRYELGAKRGLHLAWTALQIDWTEAADAQSICQTTHPDRLHEFIEHWPGLGEQCLDNPDFLALYAPQLTIPAFSGQFAGAFDAMLARSIEKQRKRDSRSGTALTIDGDVPLCEKNIALRHPSFGNYEPSSIACFYVQGEMFAPPTRCHETFDYAIWLLSRDSEWLPAAHRRVLTLGMRNWAGWSRELGRESGIGEDFIDALYRARSPAGYLRKRANLTLLDATIAHSLDRLGINDDVLAIRTAFVEQGFIEGTFELDKRHAARRSRGG